MSYAPLDPTVLVAPLDGNAAAWTTLYTNHDQLYQYYRPPIVDNRTATATSTSASAEDVYEFECLGNYDLAPLSFRVRCTTTGGNGTLTCLAGASSNTATINGAAAWYTVAVTPSAADCVCKVQLNKGTGTTMTADAVQCYTTPSAPGAGTLTSAFVRAYGRWDDANVPIPSEVVSRYLNGPPTLARERPVCVASALAPINAGAGGKSAGNLMTYNDTIQSCILQIYLPACDELARRYKFRMRLRNSASVGALLLKVGAWEESYTPASAGEWWTTSATLAPGPHKVVISAEPGTVKTQQVATLQIWRA